MYSKDEMILWSMIYSITKDIGKIEVFALSSKILFKLFKFSLEREINIFKCSHSEKIKLIDEIGEGNEYEKIKNFFGDFQFFNQLKKQIKIENKLIIEKGIQTITFLDKKYPKFLKNFDDPPFVIYYKGSFPMERNLKNSLAVVGTRNPQDENINLFTYSVIKRLKDKNAYNISGLALGCDTISHKISLKLDVKNIVVLGQGLGTEVYPKENEELLNEIIKRKGVVISEIPPSLKVKGVYLLRRNRLQTYLSEGICVLETGDKGGTITTLKYAFKIGKNVYIRKIEKHYNEYILRNLNKIKFINCGKEIDYYIKRKLERDLKLF